MKSKAILYFVIPVYNESLIINETINILSDKLDELIKNKKVSSKSKILFVEDGSKDNTWELVEKSNNKYVEGLSLSTNFGQQNSLYAGYLYASEVSDIVISMDADMQDDISIVEEMIDNYYQGYDIVYGVRSSRKKDFFLKRFTANAFYKFMHLMGVDIINNHAEYRLVSKKVINELANYSESDIFLRGIFPLMGFKNTKIYYERQKRIGGKSKYSFGKMMSFAWNAITSFSIKPLRFISFMGFVILFTSIGFLINYLICNGDSTLNLLNISIWFIGGVQLLCLGIIGEYVGKIYKQTKNRPRYIINKIVKK